MATMTDQERIRQTTQEFNDILRSDPVLREIAASMFGSRSARFLAYTAKGIGFTRLFERRGNRVFCYTTERVRGKFASYQLVNTKAGGPAKPRLVRYHKLRKAAKARAKAMRDGFENGS